MLSTFLIFVEATSKKRSIYCTKRRGNFKFRGRMYIFWDQSAEKEHYLAQVRIPISYYNWKRDLEHSTVKLHEGVSKVN